MAPFLGGFQVTSAAWISSHAIRVGFSTSYGASYLYQLYAGRTLIGATSSPSERSVVGQLQPSNWPQWLQLVAVAPDQRLTEYGANLPPRPYNRVKVRASVAGDTTDALYVELATGTEPEGAVDPGNVVERVLFDEDRVYELLTPPLEGSGLWNLELATRDDKPPDGNRGTPLELTATVLSTPPDVSLVAGQRFSVALDAGTATLNWTNA